MNILYSIFRRLSKPWQWRVRYLLLPHFLVGGVALIMRDQEILLIQVSYGEGWYLPGGFFNPGEDAITGLKREMQEELHAEFIAEKICMAEPSWRRSWEIVVRGTLVGELLLDNKELVRAEYFPIYNLPTDLDAHHRSHVERFALT